MAKVTDLVARLAQPLAEAAGCSLWDVEYVKEAGTWYLRIYIDKETGVSIDDCEAVSRPLSDALDEADPIEGSYTLEVSSCGEEVEVRLYRPKDGKKDFVGRLTGWADGDITLELNGMPITFEKKEVAQTRLYPRF